MRPGNTDHGPLFFLSDHSGFPDHARPGLGPYLGMEGGGAGAPYLPWTEWDTCENITFPRTTYVVGNWLESILKYRLHTAKV